VGDALRLSAVFAVLYLGVALAVFDYAVEE
jgi:hypothetical protein